MQALAAGERRQDRHLVAVTQLVIGALEVTNVLVVEVDVHEAMQLPLFVHDLRAEARVTLIDVPEHLAHGIAIGAELALAADGVPDHRGDMYLHGQESSLS